MSENLPHKSGITTFAVARKSLSSFVGKLAPQIGDYDKLVATTTIAITSRKTCPTNRGLRLRHFSLLNFIQSRKTCPTNRGLRLFLATNIALPTAVGKLAPQIGDYDQTYTTFLSLSLVGKLAPQIGDYDRMPLAIAFFTSVGKLAPQIGDYDPRRYHICSGVYCRKTCPTNRGLRPPTILLFNIGLSRKTCPTNRGLRPLLLANSTVE